MTVNTRPDISVIIPAYNASAKIEPLIRTILREHRVELELIVVNDGSVDNTGRITTITAHGTISM